MEALGKVTRRVPRGTERDSVPCHHAAQNGLRFTTREWLLSGLFPSRCPDRGGPRVPEGAEREAVDKGTTSDGSRSQCSEVRHRAHSAGWRCALRR